MCPMSCHPTLCGMLAEVRDGKLILTRAGDYVQIGGKFPRLAAPGPSARLREILGMIRSL